MMVGVQRQQRTIIVIVVCFMQRYTHIEGECPFITFDELLDKLEDLICDVVQRVLDSPYGHIVQELNPVSVQIMLLFGIEFLYLWFYFSNIV